MKGSVGEGLWMESTKHERSRYLHDRAASPRARRSAPAPWAPGPAAPALAPAPPRVLAVRRFRSSLANEPTIYLLKRPSSLLIKSFLSRSRCFQNCSDSPCEAIFLLDLYSRWISPPWPAPSPCARGPWARRSAESAAGAWSSVDYQ